MTQKFCFPIRFKFNVDKFIACLSLFAKEAFRDFSKLKAAKLLYFADKYHVIHYGRPITGDIYIHQDYGPIPSKSLDIMNEVLYDRDTGFIEEEMSNRNKVQEFISVKRGFFRHRYPIFVSIKEPALNCLSETELEAVRETIKRYGKYSPGKLVDLTHKEAAWQNTQKNDEIDYRLFFENEPEAKGGAKEYMELAQEEREICHMIGFHG